MTHAQLADLHRFTRRQYARMIDHGVLGEDDSIELLDGPLLVKERSRARTEPPSCSWRRLSSRLSETGGSFSRRRTRRQTP